MAKLISKPKQNYGTSKYQWILNDFSHEAGTYPGIILDVLEVEDVERTYKDQSKVVDICRFLVAYTDDEGKTQMAQTFEFTISGFEKSNLVQFCANLRGKMPPLDGSYDFCDEIGTKCMVTIDIRTSKEKVTYGYVKMVAPISKKLAGDCPNFEESVKLIPGGWKFGAKQDEESEDLPPKIPKDLQRALEKDNEEDPF